MSSNAPVVIQAEGLSKHYPLFDQPSDRLKQMLFMGRKQFYTPHKAIENVSLTIRKGESIGVIGHNGSGKSTLLQLICGTLTPTSGTVSVTGRVAALLELGAGFNPEFTGRENIFLYGAVLGFSQEEMDARYDDICAFADIGAFIDQPLTSYSSGMVVRLAFAVSTAVEPDILIVDEALAVGDEAFQRKCYGRIQDLRAKGCTLLFVSHSVVAVSELCSRVVLMDHGQLIGEGLPSKLIAQYQSLLHASSDKYAMVRQAILDQRDIDESEDGEVSRPASCVVYPENGVRIENPAILDARGKPVQVLEKGKTYQLSYSVAFMQRVDAPHFAVMIRSLAGADIGGAISTAGAKGCVEVGQKVRVSWKFKNRLNQGVYYISAGVTRIVDEEEEMLHRIVDALEVRVLAAKDSIATGRVDMEWDLKATVLASARR